MSRRPFSFFFLFSLSKIMEIQPEEPKAGADEPRIEAEARGKATAVAETLEIRRFTL
jgi:hypothetical protein